MNLPSPRHPFRRFRQMLRRIPDRRARGLAVFFLGFAASLIAGRIVETLFSKATFVAVEQIRTVWLGKLEAFSPVELATGYISDFGPASRGAIVYKTPRIAQGPSSAEVTEALQADAARRAECLAARAEAGVGRSCVSLLPRGETAATCMVNESAEGCEAYHSCVAEGSPVLSSTPAECAGLGPDPFGGPLAQPTSGPVNGPVQLDGSTSKAAVPGFLVPLAALVRTVTRIFSGGVAAVAPVMQLALGALLAAAFVRDSRNSDEEGLFLFVVIWPVAAIAFASASAFVLKWLMVGALAGFGWVTGFADFAAGAGGMIGACWYCFSKLTEKGVEAAITGKAS